MESGKCVSLSAEIRVTGTNEFISRGMQILGLTSIVTYRREGKVEEEKPSLRN